MRYLLTLLLVMGMMAPAYADVAGDAFKAKQEATDLEMGTIEQIKASKFSDKEKIEILSGRIFELAGGQAVAEVYIDWFIEGISRALGASPLAVRDSIPSGMMNADIPEFLVRQLMNIQAMKRTQDEVVGAPKAPPVLYLGIKLTGEEVRRLTSSDDMINFVISHEDRVFFQVQK